MLHKTKLLNINVTNETENKILEYLSNRLKKEKEKTFIITPNPEMLVYATKHLDYQDSLNHADIALPDGIGLFFASGLLGKPLQERITGVDFLEKLCEVSAKLPLSMGFLGGKDDVAERTADRLKKKYPWIDVAFVASEWNEKGFIKRKPVTIDILFVAFGVPKQEEWIYEHLATLPVKSAIGVGGAFDYLSGAVPRAPYLVRFLGLEWLFRLSIQPWRLKRQLALLEFIFLILKQKFSKA